MAHEVPTQYFNLRHPNKPRHLGYNGQVEPVEGLTTNRLAVITVERMGIKKIKIIEEVSAGRRQCACHEVLVAAWIVIPSAFSSVHVRNRKTDEAKTAA